MKIMKKETQAKKNRFDSREAILLEALDNIKQRAIGELYESDREVVDIIRDIVDRELLDLEMKRGK